MQPPFLIFFTESVNIINNGHGIYTIPSDVILYSYQDKYFTRISEDTSSQARKFIQEFRKRREEIILESLRETKLLIKWLYENQWVRRFDAASKFFLILINLKHLEDSWKLKRNKRLLEKSITNYINNNKNIDKDEFKVSFKWQGKIYTTYATALFVLVR